MEQAGALYCWNIKQLQLVACGAGGGGGVSSVVIAGTSNQVTVSGTCTITSTGTCTLSLPAAIILGTDNSTAGTLQLANGSAAAHTIFGSGATTTNTINGFATVPTTGHLIDCTVTTTTCLLHDSGVVTANVVNASSPAAGIAHFAGSTQTVTSSAVVSADLNITPTTCTNQAITAISATAVGTCTTFTLASAQFANQGTTTTVLHGNAAGNPSFGSVVTGDIAANAVTLAKLATQTADTVLMNASGSTAVPSAVAMPSTGTNGCAGTGNALTYNTTTHALGCNTISGSGTVSGLTTGFLPEATSATSLSTNSPIDDGITTVGVLTSTKPIAITASGGVAGGVTFTAGTAIGHATASTVTVEAGATTTAYEITLPIASATGILHLTNTSNVDAATISAVSLTADVSGTLPIANGGTNAASAPSSGSILNTSSTTAASFTVTPTLGLSGTAGTLAMFPASGNFTTTIGSAATASNTVLFFASAPTNGHVIDCVTSSTTCTLTDAGFLAADVLLYHTPATGIARTTSSSQSVVSTELSGDATTSGSNAVTVVQVEGAVIPTSAAVIGTNSSKQLVAATGHQIVTPLNCSDSSGSGSAQLCTTTPTFSPAKGDQIIYYSTTQNSGALTLNVNSSAADAVQKWQGSALASGDIKANIPVLMVFDGTNWQVQNIGNAPSGGSASLSSITAAAGSNTIANGNNPQVWNWAQTTNSQTAFTFGETTAATGTSDVEHQITTLTTSTAVAFQLTQGAAGPANSAAPNLINITAAAAGGAAGASNAGSAGAAINLLTGAGSAGGATTGIGGAGGAFTITEGAGGAAGGTATNNGGNGGGVAWATGAGGNGGTGAATAGSGGAITFTMGAPGTNSSTGTAGTVGLFNITGSAPASTTNATGVSSGTLFSISGVTGGATTNASGTGGVGSSPSITAGAGGAASGATASTGGAGGTFSITTGAGGTGAGTGVNSNGGNFSITLGIAGTGGSGTAGKAGVVAITDTVHAGFEYYTQGTLPTTANVVVPASSIIETAPAAVTAYTLTKPGAAPVNNFSVKTTTTAGVESYNKMPQTSMLTSQYTNSTTGFTNVTGGNSLAFTMDASTTYQGYCTLYYQAASTGGLNIEFTGPASPTFVTYGLVDPGTATTIVAASVATSFSTSLGAAVGPASTNFPAFVYIWN